MCGPRYLCRWDGQWNILNVCIIDATSASIAPVCNICKIAGNMGFTMIKSNLGAEKSFNCFLWYACDPFSRDSAVHATRQDTDIAVDLQLLQTQVWFETFGKHVFSI